MVATISPTLLYDDAKAAIRLLKDAFGFTESLSTRTRAARSRTPSWPTATAW